MFLLTTSFCPPWCCCSLLLHRRLALAPVLGKAQVATKSKVFLFKPNRHVLNYLRQRTTTTTTLSLSKDLGQRSSGGERFCFQSKTGQLRDKSRRHTCLEDGNNSPSFCEPLCPGTMQPHWTTQRSGWILVVSFGEQPHSPCLPTTTCPWRRPRPQRTRWGLSTRRRGTNLSMREKDRDGQFFKK